MDFKLGSRLRHAWNAFTNKDPTGIQSHHDLGYLSSYRPDRVRLTRGNERSIITSIYNRFATDCAAVTIEHVRLDDNERYTETINSGLNTCLNVEANLDQTGRAFKQDLVMSLLDEGCIAIVPVDTTINPYKSSSYEINSMRVGKILEWYPEYVKVSVYNEKKGYKEDLLLPKKMVGIVENPFYSVMNEPNSTLQRLIRKMILLDFIDEQSGSGKLDLIIQLPYTIKTEARRIQADQRRQDIIDQLASSQYGIAYTDGTERITQLNRSVENNLLTQIEYLTSMLFSQLGITKEVLEGSADETTMVNYHNRIVEPILAAIVDEMRRKFLTKTARSQGQSIIFFREPFKLVTVSALAEIGDRFTRNEIMTSNELRQVIGIKPSSDPAADELRNKNLNPPETQTTPALPPGEESGGLEEPESDEDIVNNFSARMKELDDLDKQLDELEKELEG